MIAPDAPRADFWVDADVAEYAARRGASSNFARAAEAGGGGGHPRPDLVARDARDAAEHAGRAGCHPHRYDPARNRRNPLRRRPCSRDGEASGSLKLQHPSRPE